MPQTILGIDIGTHSVKVAEIRRSFKAFSLVNFFTKAVRYNDVLSREESVASAVQSVLEDNALTWDVAYVALPPNMVATRLIVLPFGAAKKIEQTLPFEIESYLPLPMEDVLFDYTIVESTKDLSRVLVFYAKKSEVAEFLRVLQGIGVDPRRLCVLGVELLSLVALGGVPPDVAYAIIDVGHDATTISVCQGKHLCFTRSVMVGGAQMIDAIATAVGVAPDEAERLLREIGHVIVDGALPPPETIPYKVTHAIAQTLDALLLELRQTFFAVREQYGLTVEAMYLGGGLANLSGLDTLLSVRMQQNVTFIDVQHFTFTQLEHTELPPNACNSAVALALRGVAPSGLPTIDFRQGEFIYRANTEGASDTMRRIAYSLAGVVLLACASFGIRWYNLSHQLEAMDQETVKMVTNVVPKELQKKLVDGESSIKTLEGEVKDAKRKVEKLTELYSQSALNQLLRFSKGVPPRDQITLNVEKYELTKTGLKVSAAVREGAEVDKLRSRIEAQFTTHKNGDGKMLPPEDGLEPLVVTFSSANPDSKGQSIKFDIMLQTETAALDAEKKSGKKK